jgi:hypothetical protein
MVRETADVFTRMKLVLLMHTAYQISRLNSGSRHEVDENCTLLGYYAASSDNCLPTFRDNLSVPSSKVKNLENGSHAEFFGWNAHSNGEFFFVFSISLGLRLLGLLHLLIVGLLLLLSL